MNVRAEIEKFSSEDDKPVLLLLLSKYRWASEWGFVASSKFHRYGKLSYQSNRVWSPTEAGRILYKHFKECDNDKE